MRVDIGIIGAMESEVRELISRLDSPVTESFSGVDFHLGRLLGKQVVIARCGVGKVFAAICAEIMILKYSPALLVNTGVAGAIAPGIITGDVVVARRLVQHDMDTSPLGDPKGLISGINVIYFETDVRAKDILLAAATELEISASQGTIATGDRFVASREEKERLLSEFTASACEMEGGAVAQVAYVNKTPFIVIRAISDSADGSATVDYPTFLAEAAKNSAAMNLALVKSY